jgi:hypothetical protein
MAASTGITEWTPGTAEAWVPGWSALEQERREVYESVMEAARWPDRDTDCEAACTFLLRHLAFTAKKRPPSGIM